MFNVNSCAFLNHLSIYSVQLFTRSAIYPFSFFAGASNLKAEARKPSGLTNSTNTPPCTPTGGVGTGSSTSNSLGSKADIARHHIASELLQTEKNFVKILNLIVNVSHCQQHSKHNYISLLYCTVQ